MAQSYLSLIQILNLLHHHQHVGEKHTEALSETVCQARLFAHKLLGRGLENLSPDARILLLLLEEKISLCRCQHLGCSTFRLSRRELQKKIGWNRSRLKMSLDQLISANYLRKNSKKKSCLYEMLYDSAKIRRVRYVMHPQGPNRID